MSNSIFIYGKPGTGKSTLALTAPSPIVMVDCDNKSISSGVEDVITILPLSTPLMSGTLLDSLLCKKAAPSKVPQGYIEFCNRITSVEEMEVKPKTLIVDSLSTLEEHLRRYILFALKTPQMHMGCWEMLRSVYCDMFSILLNMGIENTIFIAHDKVEKNDITGAIEYRPFISGSTKDSFAMHFSEIYHTFTQRGNNGIEWGMRTVSDGEYIARNTRKLPEIVINPSLDGI